MTIYTIVELSASLIESLLIINLITLMSGRKYGNIFNSLLVLGLASIQTVIVAFMNSLAAFSFVTILVASLYALIVTKFTSNGGILLRATACMLGMFFLHSFDYIVGFSVSLIFGHSKDIYHGFELMMRSGDTRTIYTMLNKSMQTLLFFLLKPYYEKLCLIPKKYQVALLEVTTSCYIIMSILFSLIMSDSLVVMQIAIIFSWLFIMICLIVIILMIVLNTKYQKKKQEAKMIAITNKMMEKNYKQLHLNQLAADKQVHDFTNHLKTIRGMLPKDSEAEKYICKLLAVPYCQSKLCHSGNDVIDAILNCKMVEAANMHINFSYQVQLPESLNISSIDICAILSNQIDNALDACQNILEESKRFVRVTIWQRESFLFFKVKNSVFSNPFTVGNKLISNKEGEGHGLGLINIRDTVQKYGGVLDNQFSDNQFISIAMMQNSIQY